MKKKFIPAVILIAIVALFIGGYANYQKQQKELNYAQQLQTATVLPHTRDIAEFSLHDNKRQLFSNKDLLGHWSMVFFGFTNCGYVCPTTMAALKNMTVILQQKNIKAPQVILVSIDPKRDTIKKLNTYVTAYNSDFIGLTGTHKKINALAKDLNVLYLEVQPKANEENYDIDHSGAILLVNPQGKIAAIFSMPHQPEVMAHDFTLIQKYAKL